MSANQKAWASGPTLSIRNRLPSPKAVAVPLAAARKSSRLKFNPCCGHQYSATLMAARAGDIATANDFPQNYNQYGREVAAACHTVVRREHKLRELTKSRWREIETIMSRTYVHIQSFWAKAYRQFKDNPGRALRPKARKGNALQIQDAHRPHHCNLVAQSTIAVWTMTAQARFVRGKYAKASGGDYGLLKQRKQAAPDHVTQTTNDRLHQDFIDIIYSFWYLKRCRHSLCWPIYIINVGPTATRIGKPSWSRPPFTMFSADICHNSIPLSCIISQPSSYTAAAFIMINMRVPVPVDILEDLQFILKGQSD
ncbi:hypothetical protein DEU56DRAFT_898230, partial [Suillus clintonianus]|uniref:uncharacterized protein n=1 Tax=Suillus clintonianus TaxID=1904413 RepID=UPI001B85E626